MADKKLTSTEVTYLLVEAKAVGNLTVTEHGDYVRITGPKDDRTRAFHVLFDHGLTVAPYPDHDDWIRTVSLAIANLKGGVGKTTTAVYLAAGLHRTSRTLLVDADPQQSALLWSQQDPIFPYTVVSLPVRDLHRRLADLGRGYDHVIVDTPPGDLGIIRSAVMAVDTVLVPASPTGLDLNRLMPTVELLAELEPVHPVEIAVLLTKVRRGTVSARSVREVLAEVDLPVMDTEIPLAEQYAGSFGIAPTDLGAYEELIRELKQ